MADTTVVYEWACPICDITRISLTDRSSAAIEAQAENAVRSHVENTNGDRHGVKGEVPSEFTAAKVASYARIKERFGDQTAPKSGP